MVKIKSKIKLYTFGYRVSLIIFYSTGIMIWNVVPLPCSVSNVIFPLKCARIVEYDINNPRPVPFFPLVVLNVQMNTSSSTTLHGNIVSLVQVINNMISNSIQAYNGVPNKEINFIVDRDGNNIVFSIQDFAGGLPKEVDRIYHFFHSNLECLTF